jgi:glycosyltransferase involved in cell wall biosynthesis
MKALRIAVITPRYAVSGVALAQWRFAAALARRGHRVDLIIGRCDQDLRVPRAPGVTIHVLGVGRTRAMAGPLFRYLRRERPDVLFSAEDHLNTILLATAIAARSGALISGSSRVPPSDTYSNKPFTKRWALKWCARAVAWRADALTCVSQDMVDEYRKLFPRGRQVCVYNIIDEPAAHARMAEPVEDEWFAGSAVPTLVAAGTLAPYKGFADLIEAMAVLLRSGRRARLVILGEGPSRDELESLVARHRIAEHVRLPGRVDNPLKYFAKADLFVLSSYAEGLPNVLVEAMLCGCTPVATNCVTGPREVLQDGRFGYLVPVGDPLRLAAGIGEALDRPIPPQQLTEAVAPFGEATVIRRHFELLGLEAG